MYRQSELGLLVRLDPERAAKEIVRAYRKVKNQKGGPHKRTVERAAAELEVSVSSLKRWIKTLVDDGHLDDGKIAEYQRRAAA